MQNNTSRVEIISVWIANAGYSNNTQSCSEIELIEIFGGTESICCVRIVYSLAKGLKSDGRPCWLTRYACFHINWYAVLHTALNLTKRHDTHIYIGKLGD